MPVSLALTNGEAIRRDWADHSEGERLRAHNRALVAAGARPDGNSPWAGEAFSFTPDEYALLKKTHRFLFEGDPRDRQKRWKAWAQTAEGRAFRVR